MTRGAIDQTIWLGGVISMPSDTMFQKRRSNRILFSLERRSREFKKRDKLLSEASSKNHFGCCRRCSRSGKTPSGFDNGISSASILPPDPPLLIPGILPVSLND